MKFDRQTANERRNIVIPLEKVRQREAARLHKAFDKAVERLKLRREQIPALEVYDFGYIDGSFRNTINDRGGFARPSVHFWKVGDIFGRDLLIYEEVNYEVWVNNHCVDDFEKQDTGEYFLAIEDPEMALYHRAGIAVHIVDWNDPKSYQWILDDMITASALLEKFYTQKDVTRRTQQFLEVVGSHSAQPLLTASA